MGTYVDINATDGAGTMRAYLATPEKGSGPGLVLLQEIFGVNAFMKDMADYFAEEGYVVMVPDLFWRIEPGVELGSSEEERAKAFELYGKLDVDKSMEDVAATIAALRDHESQVGKVGAVGYCLGGRLAWLTAARTDIDAAVGYYGVKIEGDLAEKGRITAPLMLHFAELDGFTPPEVIEQISSATADMPNVEIHTYPGADHGFARPTGANYGAQAAAWQRFVSRAAASVLGESAAPSFICPRCTMGRVGLVRPAQRAAELIELAREGWRPDVSNGK